MKMLYKSFRPDNFYILKTILENQGIDVTVKNEDIFSLGPRAGFLALELWINNDNDYKRAEEILKKYLKPESSTKTESWKCKKCGEMIDGQFSACWKCGNDK